MLTPEELNRLPDSVVELYAEVEQEIINDMAKRLSQMDFIPSAEWQYKKLLEMGATREKIIKALSKKMNESERTIRSVLKTTIKRTMKRDMTIYRAAGLKITNPAAFNELQRRILQSGFDNTNRLFQNITRTTAESASQQFVRAMDKAWLQITTGAFDRNSALKIAIKSLTEKGLESVTHPSGRTDHLDVAVRRAVVTGVNQTSMKMQERLADEMDCDLVEVTAHAGARTGKGVANHAAWQGKIYSRSGRSTKYPSLVEKTGYGTGEGLGGWNCRHNFFPFIEGVSTPAHTQEELDALNAPKYTYNGKKLTEYEAQQVQRNIERNIRKYKREESALKSARLPSIDARVKREAWQSKMEDFIKQTGLKRQLDRERAFKTTSRSETVAIKKHIDKLEQEVYNIKKSIKAQIGTDYPLTLNVSQQNKHIIGTKEFDPQRSTLTADPDELIKLYAGKGDLIIANNKSWTNRERFVHTSTIGTYRDVDGKEYPTNAGLIHYSKKRGCHIVPAKPIKKGGV